MGYTHKGKVLINGAVNPDPAILNRWFSGGSDQSILIR
jgi:hypothetical protein